MSRQPKGGESRTMACRSTAHLSVFQIQQTVGQQIAGSTCSKPEGLCACMQVLVVLCLILFVLCLPVRLILGLCCGIKLQPPQRERDGDEAEPDQDTDPVIINIPPDVVVDRPAHSEVSRS